MVDRRHKSLRVACCQLSPVFKDVKASIARADELVASLKRDELDMLVLPELAFTGYCFISRADIAPWTEDPSSADDTGPTFAWASATAQRLNAYILIGFAQRLPPGPAPSSSGAHALPSPLYNSQMIVSPSGNLVSVYAKHFLYTTDEAWATPGPSFTTVSLPFPCSNPAASGDDNDGPPSFTIAPGICMDLNPEGFIAPFEAFEFATFVREAKPRVDVVVCSMAWLASEKEEEGDEEADGEEEDQAEDSEWHKVSGTIDYWATRLSPLVGTPTAFLASNRVGSEGEVTFTGSSCVLELQGLTVVAHAKQSGEEVVCAVVRIE